MLIFQGVKNNTRNKKPPTEKHRLQIVKDYRPEVTKFVVSFDSADRKKMQTSWGFQDVQGEVR